MAATADKSALPSCGLTCTTHPRDIGWSGRRGSNPRPTAWKAVTLPLSYSRLLPSTLIPLPYHDDQYGGEGRVRTSVAARAADLQSAAIDRSATSPCCLASLDDARDAPSTSRAGHHPRHRSATSFIWFGCLVLQTDSHAPRQFHLSRDRCRVGRVWQAVGAGEGI